MTITLNALEMLCVQAEKNMTSLEPFFTIRVYKKYKNNQKSTRILPGVKGQILEWGNGTETFPSIVLVYTKDIREFIKRARTIGVRDIDIDK